MDLPDQLRHRYGKLIVILDSASCHKSKKVMGSSDRVMAT